MTARITKLLLLSSGVLLSLSLAAQYPSNPAKSRLGYQTTGDGLIFRGAGAPAYSPGTLFNAWTYLDTTNMILYGYKNFSWVRLPSANNGLTMSGAYAQLGGSLNQNTTIESGTYNLKLGKTSGTNYAYMNTYGSGVYAGMYSVYGTNETDFAIGGGNYNLTSNDSDDTNQFTFTPTGFDFTYIGGSGVSRFGMDSAMFYMYGLPSFASHAAATTGIGSNGLYRLTDKRAIYVNNGTANDLEMPFDSITFTPGTVQPDTAELKYSSDLETLVFGADGTVIEIGQKEAWYVKNQTGSTIAKGTVVRASGTLGSSGRILISPMIANGTVSSKYLLGITASNIANGADGYVIHFGKLRKTNTNSWNEGDVLYASATTPGALTNIEPAPPNLRLPIAFVVHKHATNGVLAVRIQTGNELHELHDVDTSGINAGEGLVYNSTSNKWQASAGKLITTVDTASMLINYPSTVGWGILKSTKTIRTDSSKVASRFFVNSNFFPLQGGTLTGTGGAGFVGFPSQVTAPGTPASGLNVYAQGSSFNWKGTDGYERQFASTLTGGRTYTLPNASGTFALGTGTATRIPIWTSDNILGNSPALYNSTTKRWTWDSPSILELPMGTDAQRPSPATTSDFWYNTTGNGLEWYNGTRWAKVLESTFNRGTQYRIPHFNANGQIIDDATFKLQSGYLYMPNIISTAIQTYNNEVWFNNGGANSFLSRWYSPSGGVNQIYFYTGGVYRGAFGASGTEFSLTHSGKILLTQQGGTLPYLTVGGNGVGIGIIPASDPSYSLHIQGSNAVGLPRGTVAQRPTIISSTTPFRYNTDSTFLEYGESVGTWRQLATRAYVRSLAVTDTWLGSRLTNGNVSISEQTRDLRLGLRGFFVDSIYINSQTVPENTIILNKAFFSTGGITATTGNSNSVFNGLITGSHGGFGNYAAHGATIYANSSGTNFNNAQGISTVIYGEKNQAIGYNLTTGSSSAGKNTMYGRDITANNFNSTILIGDSLTATANGQVKIGNSLNNSQLLFGQKFIYDYDTYILQLSDYGTGTKEAADLSKTESVYNAIYATDGTVIEKRANTEQYNTITSTSSPQTLSSTIADNLINQGSTQATFTLKMPASPVDGQVVMITYNNAISTLTIDGNGQTIVGSAVTTAVAGSQRKFKFYTGIGWIKQY